MVRRGTKAARSVLAGEDEGDSCIAGEGCGVVEEMEGCEAPVDAGETEVCGEVIVEAIRVRIECLDVLDVRSSL